MKAMVRHIDDIAAEGRLCIEARSGIGQPPVFAALILWTAAALGSSNQHSLDLGLPKGIWKQSFKTYSSCKMLQKARCSATIVSSCAQKEEVCVWQDNSSSFKSASSLGEADTWPTCSAHSKTVS